jgi:hypothetical protein
MQQNSEPIRMCTAWYGRLRVLHVRMRATLRCRRLKVFIIKLKMKRAEDRKK